MQWVRMIGPVCALLAISAGSEIGVAAASEPRFDRLALEGATSEAVPDAASKRRSPTSYDTGIEHELPGILAPLATGQIRVLYLAAHGPEVQLRIRRLPYPGAEAVIWSGMGRLARTSCLPSPNFTRAAVLYDVAVPGLIEYKLAVVRLDGSRVETTPQIPPGNLLRHAIWEGNDTLLLLTSDLSSNRVSEWRLNLTGPKLTLLSSRPRDWSWTLGFLEEHFSAPVAALRRAVREKRVSLREDESGEAVLRSVGIPVHPDLAAMSMQPTAAVSPGEQCAALAGSDGKLSVVGIASSSAGLQREVQFTKLLAAEHIYAEDLRWT